MFSPLDSSDLWMALITAVTIMLAAPSGVGGGGILVPMYLVFGLSLSRNILSGRPAPYPPRLSRPLLAALRHPALQGHHLRR